MARFVTKALEYLGLKDIDEDGYYEDDDYEAAPSRARTTYPDTSGESSAPTGQVAALRPLRDDSRDGAQMAGRGIVKPLVQQRQTKPRVVTPARFSDAQQIGDLVKANHPVIVNLQASERDLARRMIDFCSGLTYALSGTMEKVAEQVFLLTPSNVEVSPEDRMFNP